MPFRSCLRLGATAAVALLAAACNDAPRSSNANPPPEPAMGRLVYDADVHIGLDSGALDVRTTIRYVVAADDERRLGLLLNRGLEVRAVTGDLVRSHRVGPSGFAPSWHLVDVEFADTVARGTVVTIEFAYGGVPEMPGDGINRITPAWVELALDSQWFPVVSTFAEEMIGDLRVTLPPGWTLVASGTAAVEGGVHVLRNRVPQVDVAFIAAPATRHVRQDRVEVHHRTMGDDAVTAVLGAAAACVQDLDGRFGARDAFPGARLVLAERDGPGYARKNYIVLSAVNPDQAEAMHQFLCHEVAHYWTRSPGSFSPDHWMSEAFAEYAAAMAVRERFGAEAFDRLRMRWEEGGRAHGPVWTPESTRRPSYQLMYRRAPYLLSRLEERIGAEGFARFVARYMTEGAATTPRLLEHLSVAAGAEAAEWFRTELGGSPGVVPAFN